MNEDDAKCSIMSEAEILALRAMIAEYENKKRVMKFLRDRIKAIGFWTAIGAGVAGGIKTLFDMLWRH